MGFPSSLTNRNSGGKLQGYPLAQTGYEWTVVEMNVPAVKRSCYCRRPQGSASSTLAGSVF